jgi:hypothetical protein
MELSTRALCTVEAVKEAFGHDAIDDTGNDDLWIRLINARSDWIHRRAKREFKVAGTNPQTRVFDVDRYVVDERELPVGDLATMITVTIKQADGTLVENADTAKIVVLPRIREEWQPVDTLRFLSGVTGAASLAHGYVVEVHGNYGFAAVPKEIEDYAIASVIERFIRLVPMELGEEEVAMINRRAALFRRDVDRYRVPTIA